MGFSAVNTGNNLLFLVVSGLLAFMSVTGYAGMRNIKGLTPEIIPPAEIFAGTAAPFRLRIRNHKQHATTFLVRLECPGGQGVVFPLVGRGSSAEEDLALIFPDRGRTRIDRITVSSPFPVNFFTRYWTFPSDSNFVVFPRLLASTTIGDSGDAERPGSAPRQDRGLDGELERIAAYFGNEPLRMIHWKLSARGEDLLVKEFGRRAAPPLIIDLDSLPGPGLEQRISRAAWLVRRWAPLRPVGLRCGTRFIPAGSGRRHGIHLLTELAVYGRD